MKTQKFSLSAIEFKKLESLIDSIKISKDVTSGQIWAVNGNKKADLAIFISFWVDGQESQDEPEGFEKIVVNESEYEWLNSGWQGFSFEDRIRKNISNYIDII
jgi:hypothetical protein